MAESKKKEVKTSSDSQEKQGGEKVAVQVEVKDNPAEKTPQTEQKTAEVKPAEGEKTADEATKNEPDQAEKGQEVKNEEVVAKESTEKTQESEGVSTQEVKPAGEEKEKSKARRFALPFMKKEASAGKAQEKVGATDEPMTPIEVVNNLDPENTIKSLAEDLDEQIEEVTDEDAVVVRFSKRKLVIVLGILVIAMWLLPISYLVQDLMGERIPAQEASSSDEVIATEELGDEQLVTVRIWYAPGEEEKAASISGILKEKGFSQIESLESDQKEYKDVLVTTKAGEAELRLELEGELGEYFPINLDYTDLEVAEDSLVDVVVFIGQDE